MIDDRIRDLLRAEIKRQGRGMKELSLAAGLGESYVRDLLDRGRGKYENVVRIAAQLGHPPEWLAEGMFPFMSAGRDSTNVQAMMMAARPPSSMEDFRQAPGRGLRSRQIEFEPNASKQGPAPTYGAPLPVLGVSRGGEDGSLVFNGEVIEMIPRPPDLEGVVEAYASYIIGDSMWPRFREGDRVWVHPRRPPRRGDDVIVQIASEEGHDAPLGFVKEYVGYSGGKLVLKQHNPSIEITFEKEYVISVHVIVGTLFR